MVGRAVERRRGSDLSTFDPPPSSISKTSRLQRLSGGSAGCARGSEIAVNQYFHLLCDKVSSRAERAVELKGDVGRGWVPLPLKLSVCLPPRARFVNCVVIVASGGRVCVFPGGTHQRRKALQVRSGRDERERVGSTWVALVRGGSSPQLRFFIPECTLVSPLSESPLSEAAVARVLLLLYGGSGYMVARRASSVKAHKFTRQVVPRS